MRQLTLVISLVASLGPSSLSLGQLTDSYFVEVDNSPLLEGYVTTDLFVSFDGQFTGAQIVLQLNAGSIFQHLEGKATPPESTKLAVFPDLVFDTYVTLGSIECEGFSCEPFEFPSLGGGAVDLGGPPMRDFSTTRINQAWNPRESARWPTQSDFLLSRLTLSNDAVGTLSFLASAQGDAFAKRDIPIINGAIGVPEPATLFLTTIGSLVSAMRRRCSF